MLAASQGQALWYLTRGTGAVTLIGLSLSVVLGMADVGRWHSRRWPRFVVDGLHRNVSLGVLVLLAGHVVTTLLDGYAPIGVLNVVVPFTGAYRPIWLGLGALALDVLVAVNVSSMLRGRLGHRAWRTIHWAAWACWPLAVVHGLGTGTDSAGTWMLILTAVCVLVVIAAAAARTAGGWPAQRRVRAGALAAMAIAPLVLVLWLGQGPLAPGWARRAGTPARLLGRPAPAPRAGAASPSRLAVAR